MIMEVEEGRRETLEMDEIEDEKWNRNMNIVKRGREGGMGKGRVYNEMMRILSYCRIRIHYFRFGRCV